jgi:Ricin-type beta-trefoil lectin domain
MKTLAQHLHRLHFRDNLVRVFITICLIMPSAITAQAQQSTMLQGLAGKCLDVYGGVSDDGTDIILWPCHNGPNQQWRFARDGTIRGLAGKCLDVANATEDENAEIILYSCHGGPNQQWQLFSDKTIRGLGGKCLDILGALSDEGNYVVLRSCNGGPSQQWRKAVPFGD